MISAGDIRNGITFEMDGKVMQVIEFQHVKPGKGAAFVRVKMRNVITGGVTETSLNPSAKFPTAFVERKKMEYSYNDGNLYYFMDNETYELVPIDKSALDDSFNFVKENDICTIMSYKGNVFGVEVPNFADLIVTSTEPGFAGNTATNTLKPATLETGAEVKVPLFINEGDKIQVLTGTGVDLDLVALVDEEGHLDLSAGLNGSGLQGVGSGVASEAGLGSGNNQVNKVGNFDTEDLALVAHNGADVVLLDELEAIVQNAAVQGLQLEGFLIHEVVQLAVVVGVLHLLSLNESSGELGRGVQGSFGHAAGDNVAHLNANESSTLAGLDVLELDDLHNLAVHLEGNAVANIACRNHVNILLNCAHGEMGRMCT